MTFNSPRHLLGILVAAGACLSLSSCVYYDSGSYGYSSSNYGYRSASSYGYRPISRSYGRCSVCGYDPCRCSRGSGYRHNSHDHNDHYRHSSSSSQKSSSNKHRDNAYQIVGGSTGSKTKPKGYHSVDWYKSRGYDVSKLKLRNEDGDVIDRGKKKKKN